MQADSGNIMTLHPSSLTACEDMVSLGDMNNAALLHNLRLRYWEDDIFVSRRFPSSFACPLVTVQSRLRTPLYASHFRASSSLTLVLTDIHRPDFDRCQPVQADPHLLARLCRQVLQPGRS